MGGGSTRGGAPDPAQMRGRGHGLKVNIPVRGRNATTSPGPTKSNRTPSYSGSDTPAKGVDGGHRPNLPPTPIPHTHTHTQCAHSDKLECVPMGVALAGPGGAFS